MANDCAFVMYVAGRREAAEEVYRRLDGVRAGDHEYFTGVRSLSPKDYPLRSLDDGAVVLMLYVGSVANCAEYTLKCPQRYNPDSRATTLEDTARELDVDIEVFTKEFGNGFAEHYVYECGTGDCLADETRDYAEYWYDPDEFESFGEFVEAYGLPAALKREDLEDDIYCEGGFDEDATIFAEQWAERHAPVPER